MFGGIGAYGHGKKGKSRGNHRLNSDNMSVGGNESDASSDENDCNDQWGKF